MSQKQKKVERIQVLQNEDVGDAQQQQPVPPTGTNSSWRSEEPELLNHPLTQESKSPLTSGRARPCRSKVKECKLAWT